MKKTVIAALALMMAATFAVANEHGGPGPGPAAGYEGDSGYLDVASDGTVIITRATAASTRTNPAAELVAIRNGAIAWTAALPSPRTETEISGSQVIEVIDSMATGTTSPSTTLTALSIATGAQAWTLTLTGHVNSLTPFSGGTYAVVIIPATTSGGTATRNLVAISSSGVVLSTVAF